MIRSDSAKFSRVDVIAPEVRQLGPGYYDANSYYERSPLQLGLAYEKGERHPIRTLAATGDRQTDHRVVIVIGRLEPPSQQDELLHSLSRLVGKDVRLIVTTSRVSGLKKVTAHVTVVHLRPMSDCDPLHEFLAWHIYQCQEEFVDQRAPQENLHQDNLLKQLVGGTGEIPPLLQSVFSGVARNSRANLNDSPRTCGND